MKRLYLMITITNRVASRRFAEFYQRFGASQILSVLGRGTASDDTLSMLGLEATEKAVLFCVAPHSPQLVRRAEKALWLDVPGRGILMTVPVSSIGGAAARDYLLQQEAEKSMEKEITHELLVVITNQGHTDMVMDAARAAGATGGTAVHAKGTGTELAKKFFGVSIAAEKELIFILTLEETRVPIMKAIMAQAGMQTEAQSLVFSLPVSGIAGLRRLDGEN